MSLTEHEPLLRVSGMTKDFPGLRALDDVSLEVNRAEIVAVVGHNGSGKSTLVKILAGVYSQDAGQISLAATGDEQTDIHIIHQDLGLALELDAIENLGLTRHTGLASGLTPVNRRRERIAARTLLSRFGAPFIVDVPVGNLAPAQRAIVAIARALDGWTHPRNVLILDEPTEALHASEVRVLFDAVTRLAADGAGVIFISHRLDEVLELADRVIVLRDGIKVADVARDAIDHDQLVSYVTGIPAGQAEHGRAQRLHSEVALRIEGLTGGPLTDVDITVHAGEVVGVAGTLGSGREALPAMVFGALPSMARTFDVCGHPYPEPTPSQSIERGMAFVPGDRARLGSVPPMSARENLTLPNTASVTTRWGSIDLPRERREADSLVTAYDVKPPRAEQRFAQFSGGNQQKIVFAKWLRNEPRVLLLEEPTQGVDVGAKQAIYDAIDAAALQGVAVLVCSSDAKELVRLCDRVLVMRNGQIASELSGQDLTEGNVVLAGYGLAASSTQPSKGEL